MSAILSSLIWAAVVFSAVFVALGWKPKELPEQEVQLPQKAVIITVSVLAAAFCGYLSGVRSIAFEGSARTLLAFAFLTMFAVTDLRYKKIPNCFVLAMALCEVPFLIYDLINGENATNVILNSVGAGAGTFIFFLLMSVISKGGIGEGDIKAFSALAFLCGLSAIVYTVVLSFLLASLTAVILLIFRKKTLKEGIPMAPLLWLGFLVGIAVGVI